MKNRENLNEFVRFYEPKLEKFLESESRELLVNAGVQVGKTYTTLKVLLEMGCKVVYFSDRHKQMEQKEEEFKGLGYDVVRIQGKSRVCECKEDPVISEVINLSGNFCSLCPEYEKKDDCLYYQQFVYEDYQLFLAPKEYSNYSFFQEKEWEFVVWDEEIETSRKIEPKDDVKQWMILEYFGSKKLNDYKYVHDLIDKPKIEPDDLKFLGDVVYEIHKWQWNTNIFKSIDMYNVKSLIPMLEFVTNIYTTKEWLEMKCENGEKDIYFKQRFKDLYDDRGVLNSNIGKLILLNASLKKEYLKPFGIDNFEIVSYDSTEKDSTLFIHYDTRGKSFNKFNMFNVKNGKLVFKNYGEKEFENIQSVAQGLQKHGYKIGLISFKQFIEEPDVDLSMFDITGYFRGTTGMTNWNDIDVLFVFGTFTRGSYEEPYEVLFNDHTQQKNPEGDTILNHNVKLWVPFNNNKKYLIMKYCRDQDMEQVICRTGLFNSKGKVVMVFGYCPEHLTERCNVKYLGGKIDGLKTKTSDTKNMLKVILNTLRKKTT